MIHSLMWQHRLESVGLGMGSGPSKVVIGVGRVDLVEPVGVADLKVIHHVNLSYVRDLNYT
jgi:hypothetical protein